MREILAELNRRGTLRTGAAYIILGWVMLQVSGILVPAMDLPPLVLTITVWFVVACFPVVLVISWLLDVTPEGVRMTRTVKEEEAARLQRNERARGLIDFDADETHAKAEAPREGLYSLAVLPFRDLSLSDDQKHLSDGIAEEIRNTLSRIPSLAVIGRTSSCAFKGQEDAREIGELLHVKYVVEGSVERTGDRLSVKAQLVRVDTGFQLWAKAYSLTLKDIFSVQEDISGDIVRELGLSYGQETRDDSTRRLTTDAEAYALYMQGRHLMMYRAGETLAEAIALFEQATKIDPGFARAWAALAEAHAVAPVHMKVRLSESQAAAERCSRKAIGIDERYAAPWAVLGHIFMQHRAYTAMQECLDKALALDPTDRTALHHSGVAMISVGRINEAGRHFQRLHDIDPMMPFALSGIAVCRLMMGDTDAAEKYAERVMAMGFTPAYLTLAEVAWQSGDLEKAADLQEKAMNGGLVHEFSEPEISVLARSIYFDDARPEALKIVDDYVSNPGPESEAFVPVMLLRLGKVEEAFEIFARNKYAFDSYFYGALWSPSSKQARQHATFKSFVKHVGLEDYWRHYGWADKCRPVDSENYEVD